MVRGYGELGLVGQKAVSLDLQSVGAGRKFNREATGAAGVGLDAAAGGIAERQMGVREPGARGVEDGAGDSAAGVRRDGRQKRFLCGGEIAGAEEAECQGQSA